MCFIEELLIILNLNHQQTTNLLTKFFKILDQDKENKYSIPSLITPTTLTGTSDLEASPEKFKQILMKMGLES